MDLTLQAAQFIQVASWSKYVETAVREAYQSWVTFPRDERKLELAGKCSQLLSDLLPFLDMVEQVESGKIPFDLDALLRLTSLSVSLWKHEVFVHEEIHSTSTYFYMINERLSRWSPPPPPLPR